MVKADLGKNCHGQARGGSVVPASPIQDSENLFWCSWQKAGLESLHGRQRRQLSEYCVRGKGLISLQVQGSASF